MTSISVATLSSCLVAPKPPVLIDVRRQGARQASGMTIEKSIWRDPAHWLDWKDEVSALSGQVVFFCVHGHEVSQGLTAALCAMGKDAKYLQGGFSEWQRAGLAVANIASVRHPAPDQKT
jgi:thiosulfate sulfurtransferase